MALTDLHLNEDRDIHLDDANDLAVVSGQDNLEQSIGIAAGDAIAEFVGGRIEGTEIGLLEERLRRALNNDPQVSGVQSVNITEFDRRTNAITVDVALSENENFELEVSA